MPLPERLQQAARRFVTGDDEDDLVIALEVIQGFGIPRHDGEVKRQVALLCVLATRRVLFGWTELGCAGEQPAVAIGAAWDWIHTGRISANWSAHCVPAPAVHDGRIIADCDACRVEPIAAAAARTVYFITTGNPVDAALVLCDARGAALEGVESPNSLPFEEWIATIAIPAAFELRDLSEAELRC
jgi:hypothetical protein